MSRYCHCTWGSNTYVSNVLVDAILEQYRSQESEVHLQYCKGSNKSQSCFRKEGCNKHYTKVPSIGNTR